MEPIPSLKRRAERIHRLADRFGRIVTRELERVEAALKQVDEETTQAIVKFTEEETNVKGLLEQAGKEYAQKKYQLERDLTHSKTDLERIEAEKNSLQNKYTTELTRINQEKTDYLIANERQKSALNDLYDEKKRSLTAARSILFDQAQKAAEKLKTFKDKSANELEKIQQEGDERIGKMRQQALAKQQGWQLALETLQRELDAIRQEKEHTEKNLVTIKAEKEKELESGRVAMIIAKEQLDIDKATLIEKAEEDQRRSEVEIGELKIKIEACEKELQDLVVRSEQRKKEAEEGYQREENLLKEAVKTEADKRDYEQKLFEQEKSIKEKELNRLKEDYEKKKWYWDNQIRTLMMQKSVQDAEHDAERLRIDREARTHLRSLEAKRDELKQRLSDIKNRHENVAANGEKETELINQRWRFRRDRLWTVWQNRLDVLKKERESLQQQIEALQDTFSKERVRMVDTEAREEKRIDELQQFVIHMTENNKGQQKQKAIQIELEKTRIIAQIKECETLITDWMDRLKLTQDEVLKNHAGLAEQVNYLDRWYREEEKETQLMLHSLQSALSILGDALSQIGLENAA
jgi:hypothetical protein